MRGVTPSMADDRTGAAAKQAAGPVLLLWSLGIPLLHRQFQSNNITALMKKHCRQTHEAERGFPTWIHNSSVSISLSFGHGALLTAPNLC